MNTEQLKTKKTIEEFMTEAGAKAVSEVAKTLLDFHSKHPVKELSDFASQESKRAVDEFKEKVREAIAQTKEPGYVNRTLILRHEEYTLACNNIVDLIDKL